MELVFERAQWIWCGEAERENAYVCFEQRFEAAEGGPAQARVSVDGQYALWINGQLAGWGWTAGYPDRRWMDVLEVAELLHPGENRLELVVHCPGVDFSTHRAAPPGAAFEVKCGGRVLASSGPETRCAPHPGYRSGPMERVSVQLGHSFCYDAQRAEALKAHWQPPAPGRAPAQLKPRPIERLALQSCSPARLISQGVYWEAGGEELGQRAQRAALAFRPLAELAPDAGEPPVLLPRERGLALFSAEGQGLYLVLDLGEEQAGLLELELSVNAPCEFILAWGEHLDDLRVRAWRDGRNFAAGYRARAGRQRFTHFFRRLGLRYLQVFVAAPACTLYYAGVRPTPYPVSGRPGLELADALHQEIYRVARRTLRLCMHEHYEDCPWREQALYAMDARNQMLCGYYAFGEHKFARESLSLLAQGLRPDGLLELCAPARVPVTIPCFSAMFLVALQEYLSYSGDEAFAREALPVAERLAQGFLDRRGPEGLIAAYRGAGYWNFYEWRPELDGEGPGTALPGQDPPRWDAPLNCFVSLGLDRLARMERRLGRMEAAARWQEAAWQLGQAVHAAFFDREAGRYFSFLQGGRRWGAAELTQALAACCGACPEEQLNRVLQQLASGELTPVSLSHSIFRYDALMLRPGRYGRLMFKELARVYGGMLRQGATSFWETERGAWDFGGAGSLCHGWSAVPVYLYFAYGLGLRLGERGFELDRLRPVDSGLLGFGGRVETPDGVLHELVCSVAGNERGNTR